LPEEKRIRKISKYISLKAYKKRLLRQTRCRWEAKIKWSSQK